MNQPITKIIVKVVNDRARRCTYCRSPIARKARCYFRDDLVFCSMRCENGLPGGVPCKPLNDDRPDTSGLTHIGKTKRRRLFDRDPHCFWCGRLTFFKGRGSGLATIDHLYSMRHPKRAGNGANVVLACYRCNQARNDAEHLGEVFIPALAARIEIAREAFAPLQRPANRVVVPRRSSENHRAPSSEEDTHPLRVISTVEEALAFAHDFSNHNTIELERVSTRAFYLARDHRSKECEASP